jgi:hypothetical protein
MYRFEISSKKQRHYFGYGICKMNGLLDIGVIRFFGSRYDMQHNLKVVDAKFRKRTNSNYIFVN